MQIVNKKEAIILFFGDVIIFFFSLWLALLIRYQGLDTETYFSHLQPFSYIFLVWVIVFFIAGLYDIHTTILKGKLPSIVFNAQLANSVIAVLFFYFIPYFGITPKTNLFITLSVSFVLVLFWRRYGYKLASYRKKQNAILLASGDESVQLEKEINSNPRYGINIVSRIDLDQVKNTTFEEDFLGKISSHNVSFIIIDFRDDRLTPLFKSLYSLLFLRMQFIDMHDLYENIFNRIPLSLVREDWILENITNCPKPIYDFFKRAIDIISALILAGASTALYPFVFLAIWWDDHFPIFIRQYRVGKFNHEIKLTKFRTMAKSEQGQWGGNNDNRVTRIGKYLRTSRIDELPQLWNVLRGDISLIGPRPEFSEPVKCYSRDIPYYNIRHIIKPGLSGWAQINHEKHPHHVLDKEETRNKLSYDLYYIKNRSLMLDVKIALRTIKILLSFAGK
ncbi:MAG: hypothetical protein A3G52_03710 [Candidatus Taylorbacteria bacterium RIFCSPLOWO2_12_FULL_43_20]|uniref:Bacterial sugar transferase domain-containing protein n=1 Tax=Candidatus Taylorbacteria bacterium RIFCSPLOWO2_12_FULL_43_20 TaxID=1802332 RepID=A0A1G2P1R7_9BACT|nr:MAG: hypothetical protein A2825_00740 [Candidatus Taylorbacteria bacterium RIFCSPHIGHO2_01_FULL_43_120]OHA22874.1 MAG: hypothetical protein A3B98_01615 [Candidatus Taylorbacteria bacterium RIFCSPHIGHO2_02_FULL_43_55]OHA29343.1 MAG: hypothetical protein A3E92_02280 [Candidatus Taylorbacteria bacterium RIFCSPHIGHO2_12_FULL_42_34]OHA31720.1 MAG: hypothetical protein A3B09_01725 [Candidatus Taylorbacteria bacterium RIFCSPLOWO2_01_FULL_43_83]OHA38771.1 MAG: hypothetical protein A3H58_01835 [Candi